MSLTALPDRMQGMASLQVLRLMGSGLSVLPDSISRLSELRALELTDCEIEALPEALGQLRQLEILDVERCTRLTCLPSSIVQLRSLLKLRLHGCDIPINLVREYHAIISQNVAITEGRQRVLTTVVADRRQRTRQLPTEIWNLVVEEFVRFDTGYHLEYDWL
jgi:hypothetical protein